MSVVVFVPGLTTQGESLRRSQGCQGGNHLARGGKSHSCSQDSISSDCSAVVFVARLTTQYESLQRSQGGQGGTCCSYLQQGRVAAVQQAWPGEATNVPDDKSKRRVFAVQLRWQGWHLLQLMAASQTKCLQSSHCGQGWRLLQLQTDS
jgi:hypothetical protein